jgi:hypothetical protein
MTMLLAAVHESAMRDIAVHNTGAKRGEADHITGIVGPSRMTRRRRILRCNKSSVMETAADRKCSRRVLLSMTRNGHAASDHSITSSARPSNQSGTVRASALAVLRLMINSTFVACCTGRSAGFSPLRIRPV